MVTGSGTQRGAAGAGFRADSTADLYMRADMLTPADVKKIIKGMRLSEQSISIALKAFEPNVSSQEVGDQHGVSRQYVDQLKRRIRDRFLKRGFGDDDVPMGWERKTVILPPNLMRDVESLEEQAREALRRR